MSVADVEYFVARSEADAYEQAKEKHGDGVVLVQVG